MYDNVKRFPKSGDWMKRPRWGKWYEIKTVEYEIVNETIVSVTMIFSEPSMWNYIFVENEWIFKYKKTTNESLVI